MPAADAAFLDVHDSADLVLVHDRRDAAAGLLVLVGDDDAVGHDVQRSERRYDIGRRELDRQPAGIDAAEHLEQRDFDWNGIDELRDLDGPKIGREAPLTSAGERTPAHVEVEAGNSCRARDACLVKAASPARRERRQCVNWIRVRGCARESQPHRRLRFDTLVTLPALLPSIDRFAPAARIGG